MHPFGPLVPPLAEELTVEATGPSHSGAIVIVLQRALARLVHYHRFKLVGTRFEYFEGIDQHGDPVPPSFHPTFGRHVGNLGLFLEYVQTQLEESRQESHFRFEQWQDTLGSLTDAERSVTEAEQFTEESVVLRHVAEDSLAAAEEKLEATEEKLKTSEERLERARVAFGKERKLCRRFEARLKKAEYLKLHLARRVGELNATVTIRDARIQQLEEGLEEALNASDDLLRGDEDPREDMDMEVESDQEDDDRRGE